MASYAAEHKVKSFSCLDQYLCMAFAQLTYRESLRDIESSLRAQAAKLYHLGIRGNVSCNALANANATRDWRIYWSFAERVIGIARGNVPSFIHIFDGKMREVNVLDLLLPEPGAYYVMDRGYLDFERLYPPARGWQLLRHARQVEPQSRASRTGYRGMKANRAQVLVGSGSRLIPASIEVTFNLFSRRRLS